jgi:hypothetical protein
MIKKCSRCNSEINCKVEEIQSCDCSKIQLLDKAREWISQEFNSCLCLNCLEYINDTIVKSSQL